MTNWLASSGWKLTVALLLMLVAPFAIMTAYMHVSRSNMPIDVIGDYVALFVCVGIGVAGVVLLPIRSVYRQLLAGPYLIVITLALLAWAFEYVCRTFNCAI
jgi:hypothetical protein